MVNLPALRAKQPKELLRTDVFQAIPVEDLTAESLASLAHPRVITDPSRILRVYLRHIENGDKADIDVLVRTVTQLGFLFDPNSFFSSSDRQRLTQHRDFKTLMHDLTEARESIPSAAAPVLLYSMACLEYRCAPLLPTLLDIIERHQAQWSTSVLSLALHSTASLGILGSDEVRFELMDRSISRDYKDICRSLVMELGHRCQSGSIDGACLQDWARASFATVMAGLYDTKTHPGASLPVLPQLVANACRHVPEQTELDESGWAQFFLYQTLYCTDVEQPEAEQEIKRAVPMWIQERLHHRWLDRIVLHAQPQGADDLQRDIDSSLRRTNTQSLINCSAGRDWDEQHCWFTGFLLEPKLALECDSMMPLSAGTPRTSGWLALKSRLLQKMGFTVITIHRNLWDSLSEDQKDEQIMRIRVTAGYKHDRAREKRERKMRQKAHTYKGIESKRKDWHPDPPPASE